MTYLVHMHLAPRGPGVILPAHTASAIVCAANHPGVLHVVAHPLAQPQPIVGLYIREETLDQAEASARHIWQHAVAAQPWLGHWQLVRAEVPLIDQLHRIDPPQDWLS